MRRVHGVFHADSDGHDCLDVVVIHILALLKSFAAYLDCILSALGRKKVERYDMSNLNTFTVYQGARKKMEATEVVLNDFDLYCYLPFFQRFDATSDLHLWSKI